MINRDTPLETLKEVYITKSEEIIALGSDIDEKRKAFSKLQQEFNLIRLLKADKEKSLAAKSAEVVNEINNEIVENAINEAGTDE